MRGRCAAGRKHASELAYCTNFRGAVWPWYFPMMTCAPRVFNFNYFNDISKIFKIPEGI